MSHDAAMEMIWAVLDAGVKIDTWYVLQWKPFIIEFEMFAHYGVDTHWPQLH